MFSSPPQICNCIVSPNGSSWVIRDYLRETTQTVARNSLHHRHVWDSKRKPQTPPPTPPTPLPLSFLSPTTETPTQPFLSTRDESPCMSYRMSITQCARERTPCNTVVFGEPSKRIRYNTSVTAQPPPPPPPSLPPPSPPTPNPGPQHTQPTIKPAH